MFLNDIGQALALTQQESCDPTSNEDCSLYNGPLLLCSANDEPNIPANWTGSIYSTFDILKEFRNKNNLEKSNYQWCVLLPKQPEMIVLEAAVVEIIVVPTGNKIEDLSTCVFLLRDDYVKVLLTNKLSGYMNFVAYAGNDFQDAMASGFDIVYINDTPYRHNEPLDDSVQHRNAYNLLKLLQPKHVVGLTRANLPKYILDLCKKGDFYAGAIEREYNDEQDEEVADFACEMDNMQ